MTERRLDTRINQLENSLNVLVHHHEALVNTKKNLIPQPRIERYKAKLDALIQKQNEQA